MTEAITSIAIVLSILFLSGGAEELVSKNHEKNNVVLKIFGISTYVLGALITFTVLIVLFVLFLPNFFPDNFYAFIADTIRLMIL